MYLKRQTFLILGLSRSGKAAAKFLLERGSNVFIYDDVSGKRVEETEKELEALGAKRLGKESLPKTPELCDGLVLSPGIPIDHPLAVAFKRRGKAVLGETELAARFMRCPIIAVTGTNGKTTTVSMLAQILSEGGLKAEACGNIGAPMLDFCALDETSVAVAEISSFQLETLNSLCPHVAVVLNVTEDHLNRHYTMENYVFLKAKLLKNSSESEYAVLNYDDETARSFAEKTKARVVWFSVKEKVNGAYHENGFLYYKEEKILSLKEFFLGGVHNVQNALAAIACAKIMGVETQKIAESLRSFKGIKHRIEKVAEIDGVSYIDDSKGTNVDATVKAALCMKTETVLLLGGKNKGYDYSKLFIALKNSNVKEVVLYGENRYELLKSARVCEGIGITVCETFDFAVRVAALKARKGQTVLLSPASASFDEFSGYEERGDKFVEIVQSFEREETAAKEEEQETELSENASEGESEKECGIGDERNESFDRFDGFERGEELSQSETE